MPAPCKLQRKATTVRFEQSGREEAGHGCTLDLTAGHMERVLHGASRGVPMNGTAGSTSSKLLVTYHSQKPHYTPVKSTDT